LIKKGYNGCRIKDKYSTENKEQRIKNNQAHIKNYVVFPQKGMYGDNTDMGLALKHITHYSFDKAGKDDDSIDSICLLIQEFVSDKIKFKKPISVRNILIV
jgi:hypothetical protein